MHVCCCVVVVALVYVVIGVVLFVLMCCCSHMNSSSLCTYVQDIEAVVTGRAPKNKYTDDAVAWNYTHSTSTEYFAGENHTTLTCDCNEWCFSHGRGLTALFCSKVFFLCVYHMRLG